jgi:hypothetical protein
VTQPIEDGGGENRGAEHRAPLADRATGGDEQAAALVALRDKPEEKMRGVGLEGRIAELVFRSLGLAYKPSRSSSPPLACAVSVLVEPPGSR